MFYNHLLAAVEPYIQWHKQIGLESLESQFNAKQKQSKLSFLLIQATGPVAIIEIHFKIMTF